jgi:DNA repair/transcription protein MET18/MMS19
LWNFVLPKLLDGDKDASGKSGLMRFMGTAELVGKGRLAYLVAFSSLLPLIPASLCLADLERVSASVGKSVDPVLTNSFYRYSYDPSACLIPLNGSTL